MDSLGISVFQRTFLRKPPLSSLLHHYSSIIEKYSICPHNSPYQPKVTPTTHALTCWSCLLFQAFLFLFHLLCSCESSFILKYCCHPILFVDFHNQGFLSSILKFWCHPNLSCPLYSWLATILHTQVLPPSYLNVVVIHTKGLPPPSTLMQCLCPPLYLCLPLCTCPLMFLYPSNMHTSSYFILPFNV